MPSSQQDMFLNKCVLFTSKRNARQHALIFWCEMWASSWVIVGCVACWPFGLACHCSGFRATATRLPESKQKPRGKTTLPSVESTGLVLEVREVMSGYPIFLACSFVLHSTMSIGVLFRRAWIKIDGTGLDGFCSIYQGNPSIFPSGHL